MKYYGMLLLLIASTSLYAQQNFFNVPSSEITPKGRVFFQQQLNFIPSGLASSTTFDYGIGNDAEIGINYNGLNLKDYKALDFNSDSVPFSPFLLINGQKKIKINSFYAISVGTQIGITTTAEAQFGNYTFVNSAFRNKKNTFKSVVGVYYATNSYFGNGSRNYLKQPILNEFGIQFGLEQRLLKNLVFQADIITGEHSIGELVIGTAYYCSKNWVISLGLQLPMFNKVVSNGLVFELTFVPND